MLVSSTIPSNFSMQDFLFIYFFFKERKKEWTATIQNWKTWNLVNRTIYVNHHCFQGRGGILLQLHAKSVTEHSHSAAAAAAALSAAAALALSAVAAVVAAAWWSFAYVAVAPPWMFAVAAARLFAVVAEKLLAVPFVFPKPVSALWPVIKNIQMVKKKKIQIVKNIQIVKKRTNG